MTGARDLAALAQIAALAYAAREARMAALRAEEARLRAVLAALGQDRRDSAARTETGDDPARRAGADLRWHHWIDRRRQTLNIELARVLAEVAVLRQALARDFGRREAISDLARSAAQDRARNALRRAERG
jgi:hypothetical protein